MATRFVEAVEKQEASMTSVASLQEIAETIQGDALQYARSRFTQPLRAAELAEVLQRHDFVDYFKFSVAENVARTLAAFDEHVQAVHYFDPTLASDAATYHGAPDTTVNLLIQVGSNSAALKSFIAALDGALTQQARTLPSPVFASLASTLNTILITEEDVVQKRGYAALLSSLYLKPRQVW